VALLGRAERILFLSTNNKSRFDLGFFLEWCGFGRSRRGPVGLASINHAYHRCRRRDCWFGPVRNRGQCRLRMPNGSAACSGCSRKWCVGWVFRADAGTINQRCLLLRDGNGVWCWWRCTQRSLLRCVVTWWFRAQCWLLRAVNQHGRRLHGRCWGGVFVRSRGYFFPGFNNVPIYFFPILEGET